MIQYKISDTQDGNVLALKKCDIKEFILSSLKVGHSTLNVFRTSGRDGVEFHSLKMTT